MNFKSELSNNTFPVYETNYLALLFVLPITIFTEDSVNIYHIYKNTYFGGK